MRRCLCPLLGVVLVLGMIRASFAGWLGGWNYRQEIVIDPAVTPAELSGFPLLVSITDPAHPLFALANSPAGLDVVFTASDGTTLLPREIEYYSNGAAKNLCAWVNTRLHAASPTRLYMYYQGADVANSTAAWDSHYTMVQHLEEDPSGPGPQMIDSTSFGNHGTTAGGMTSGQQVGPALAKIGGALRFDGNDTVNVGNNASLYPSHITVEAWAKADVLETWDGIFTNKNGWGNGINLQMGTAQNIASGVGGTYLRTSWTPQTNRWYHIAVTHDGVTNANKLYVNGNLENSAAISFTYASPLPNSRIGSFYTDGNLAFNGILDEIRVSDAVRSAAWIKASANNQGDPAAYQTIGPVQQQGQNALTGWAYRQPIVISKNVTSSDLADFPVLVKLTDPANPLFAHAVSPQGYDIVFTAADGITQLDHEVELFSKAPGSEQLCAWVKTPVSSAQDTLIYMYYGRTPGGNPNSVGTWDDHFMAVHHLQQDPSGPGPQMKDSTWHANHGTAFGAMTSAQQTPGKVGGALDFDGADDYVSLGNDPSLYPADITMEAWVKSDTFGSWDGILTNKKAANDGINLQIGTVQEIASLVANGTSYIYVRTNWDPDPQTGQWYHVVITHDSSTNANKLYVNGVLEAVATMGLAYASPLPMTLIGDFYSPGWDLKFDGLIDEIRISDMVRSADWVLASYRLMNNPGAYLTFGAELAIPEPSSAALLALAGLALLGLARRSKVRP